MGQRAIIMADTKTLIEAVGVSKHFAGQMVLENVDFTIHEQEIITLVGLNGCGKTTLLHILMGLAKADSGSVTRINGLNIGYVPQRFHPDPILPMTVRDVLKLSAADNAAYETYIGELAIGGLLARQMTSLSGGELQRVLLARAMMRKPDLLVLDEPVQGVDMAGQTELYQLIIGLNKKHHCAVLMVSHDLHLVMAGTHQVICLNRHVCCSGTPHAVAKDPSFIHLFGDSAARTLALYEHHHDHHHHIGGEVCNDEGHKH